MNTIEKGWAEITTLRPSELSKRIQACPIVFIPSGIYEWHDEQNPLGTDTLKMIEICRRTATRTGGLVHMPSYIGVGAFFGSIGGLHHGGLNFSKELVHQYIMELLDQLEKMGFELIMLLYGHTNAENINAHEQAAKDYMLQENTQAKVLCLNDLEPVVKHRYKVADHAGKWETSFMMASCPDRVCMKSIQKNHTGWSGSGLDPREHASPEEGERMYNLIADELAKIIKTVLRTSRSKLLDNTFLQTHECWETCQNVSDLRDNFWKNDEKWEDPFCPFCIWRSSGVMTSLASIKGLEWAKRRLRLWDKLSKPFEGRARKAWQILKHELNV